MSAFCTPVGAALLAPRAAAPDVLRRARGAARRSRRPAVRMLGPRLGVDADAAARRGAAAGVSTAFVDWLQDNGTYLSPKATWGRPMHPLAIADETTDDGEPSGRGLIAIKGLTQGEAMFRVPEKLLMTRARAVELVPGLGEEVDEFIALAVLLVQERAKGDAGFWKPYLDILPRDEEYTALFRWSEDELRLLEGSPTVAAAVSLRAKLREEFEEMERTLFSRNRAAFPEDVFCIEAWEWAFAVLFSRAIFLRNEDAVALVPYADLINHSPFVSTYIDMQSELLTGDKTVALYTDRPYGKMDQVFVTYGPKSNAELLVSYGFLVERNQYDAVDLAAFPSKEDALYDKKIAFLASCGINGPVDFPLYGDRYPMELIEFLRFCVCDEDQIGGDFGNYVSEENESAAAQALVDACAAAIKAYPQSADEDRALVADAALYRTLDVKQRAAIRQRLGEKTILQRTINNVERERAQPSFMFAGPSGGGG